MEKRTVSVNLSIEIIEDTVFAKVLFLNNTTDDIFLDTWTICVEDDFRNNILKISDESNKVIPYSGPMINREVLPEDFCVLNPGKSIETRITINNGYKLTKGKNYIIQFNAFNPTYIGKQHIMQLQSNKVEITY